MHHVLAVVNQQRLSSQIGFNGRPGNWLIRLVLPAEGRHTQAHASVVSKVMFSVS